MRKKRLEACIFRAFSLFRCQRWDISISNERCTSTFSRQWGKLFFMNALIKFVMFLIAAGVLPVLSGLLPVSRVFDN